MENFEFEGRTYLVPSLQPKDCAEMVIYEKGDLTDEEKERVRYKVYRSFGYEYRIWPSRQQQIQTLKDSLTATDYIALKAFEGHDVSEYGDWKTDRQNIRNEINRLENLTDEAWNEENKAKWEK